MKKRYYLMFEMLNCINFSSRSFVSFDDARKTLEKMRSSNDSMLQRLAVGYWEEIPNKGSGHLKIFHILAECHRLSK